MAKSYSLTELAAPTGVSATPDSGGSLEASTTYYYKVVALDSNSINVESPPSAEFSATTDATNKTIDLSWSAVTGATRYVVFRTTTSGDYDVDEKHWVGGYLSTNSYSDDGTGSTDEWFISEAGLPYFECDGGAEDDRITLDDIYNWMNTNGHVPDWFERITSKDLGIGLNYVLHCNLRVDSYWKIEPGQTFIVEGKILNYADTLIGEEGYAEGSQSGAYFGYLNKRHNSVWSNWSCKAEIWASMLQDIGGFHDQGGQYHTYGPSGFAAMRANSPSIMSSSIYNFLGGNLRVHGAWRWKDTLVLGSYRAEGYLSGEDRMPKMENCKIYVEDTPPYSYEGQFFLNDSPIYGYAGKEIYLWGACGMQVFLDPTFYNDPVIGTINGSLGWNGVARIKWRVNLKVQDKDGQAIQGATIKLTDKNGRSILWEDTGATLAEDIDDDETEINVSDGSLLNVGDVLIVNEDRMVVTNISTNTITVTRGVENEHARDAYNGDKIFRKINTTTTDSNGNIPEQQAIEYTAVPHTRKYSQPLSESCTIIDLNPYTLTVSKTGYQTNTTVLTMDRKREEVVVLENRREV